MRESRGIAAQKYMEPGCRDGQTSDCRALRGGDDSRDSRRRCRILQKPIVGTSDSEHRHCVAVRSLLLAIPRAYLIAMHVDGVVGRLSQLRQDSSLSEILLRCGAIGNHEHSNGMSGQFRTFGNVQRMPAAPMQPVIDPAGWTPHDFGAVAT